MDLNIPTYIWQKLSAGDRSGILSRPAFLTDNEIKTQVRTIIESVKTGGASALRIFTERYDGVSPSLFAVDRDEFAAADKQVSQEVKAALNIAARQIKAFHAAGIERPISVETTPGVVCRRESRPVGSTFLVDQPRCPRQY